MGGRNRGGSFKGHKRGRTQRRDFRDGRENVWKKSRADSNHNAASSDGVAAEEAGGPGWAAFVKESPAFDMYYKKQCIVPEKEWEEFILTLRKPLPTTFRINGSGQFACDIRDQMQRDFFDYLKDVTELDGEFVEPVRALPWYPDKLAWSFNFSRMQLRKMPILTRIHDFLKQENEIGSISRQEAVSMLPPLFLDVQPHHRALDSGLGLPEDCGITCSRSAVCAAPGSKTFQLLEMIHKDGEPGVPSNGLVIANDLDVQRCHLLIHQTKRMCSPNILVTNHEAQHFPGLKHQKVPATSEKQEDLCNENEKGLWFDRILCDVPCSGDGTIRKAPDIWRKWNAGIGNGMHRLQVQIAMRGVSLLRLGGRLAYSTCSLNPVENEAVVSEILRQSQGSMELLDVSAVLPELKRRPGLSTWKVRDKGKWLVSYSQVNRHRAGAVVPGMFPSGKGWTNADPVENMNTVDISVPNTQKECDTVASAEAAKFGESVTDIVEEDPDSELGEVSDFPLDRCIRILPHDQDTGGFFIAVFEKIRPYKFRSTKKEVVHHPLRSLNTVGKVGIQEPKSPIGDCHSTQREDDHDVIEDKPSNNYGTVNAHPSSLLTSVALEDQLHSLECGGMHENDLQSKVSMDSSGDATVMKEGDECAAQGSGMLSPALGVNGKAMSGSEQIHDDRFLVSDPIEQINEGARVAEASMHQVNGKIQQQGPWRGVDPVLFLNDETLIRSLVSFYGITDSFPLRGHLVTRSEDISRLKRIYYVAQTVSDVIQLNLQAGGQLKIASAGHKLFERHTAKEGSSPCSFRIASEGLPVLLPFITKQRVSCSKADFKLLLSSKAVPFGSFHDPTFSSAFQNLLPGCCVIELASDSLTEPSHLAAEQKAPTAIGCWRGRTNLSVLVTKVEAEQMLERLSLTEAEHDHPEAIEEEDDHLHLSLTEESEHNHPDAFKEEDDDLHKLAHDDPV